MPAIQIPKEKWSGTIRQITLGATAAEGGTRAKTVTVGGETTLPYLHFEGEFPHPPVIAIEIQDRHPADWSPVLLDAWGDATADPAAWAKAAEAKGADIILLKFSLHNDLNGDYARQTTRKVLNATGLPLIVFGPGQAELDNDLLVAVAEEGKGENMVLGVCEDKNYRTIVAAALAHGHLVDARCPMDVNLSKQLNILISDMGL
ncbi:MAG: acetyl-CoA decarbonylase/synthase complex subunit delta, partial [Anaerolineae bacterium]